MKYTDQEFAEMLNNVVPSDEEGMKDLADAAEGDEKRIQLIKKVRHGVTIPVYVSVTDEAPSVEPSDDDDALPADAY